MLSLSDKTTTAAEPIKHPCSCSVSKSRGILSNFAGSIPPEAPPGKYALNVCPSWIPPQYSSISCFILINIKQLIEEYCGGIQEGHTFKAYLPGGASGGILPAKLDNIPLDFDTLQEHGCFIGSAAVVVLSDKDNMKDIAKNLMFFFHDESCGQCTPCRNGTEKALKLMNQSSWDVDLLKELSSAMMDASICGLGQAAPNPMLSVIKHFPEEVTN